MLVFNQSIQALLCLPLSRAITIDDTECTPKGDVVIRPTTHGGWNYHRSSHRGYTSKLNRQLSCFGKIF